MSNSQRLRGYLRAAILTGLYISVLLSSLWFAYQLRFDFQPAPEFTQHFIRVAIGLIVVKIILLFFFGQFGSLLTYFGIYDLWRILVAMAGTSVLATLGWYIGGISYAPPRAVILADLMISCIGLSGLRMGFRLIREGYLNNGGLNRQSSNVAIIGAGNVGASLVKDLLLRRNLGLVPIAFFDDNSAKWRTTIHGVYVEGRPEALTEHIERLQIREVIIAMPSASGRRVQEIVTLLRRLRLRFEIVPSYEQLLTGKVRVSQIRQVEIQDLLGRDPVKLEANKIQQLVQGQVVMVTGAGGSIGSELCRQIAYYCPQRLILIERCEYLLFQIEQELLERGYGSEILPLVADILDGTRMQNILDRFRPSLVFHAAAHKHVPMMEHQPAEAVRNNTFGTSNLAELCSEYKVERFVQISTDKAINPTSVMGATKRLGEIYLQSLQLHGLTPTKFMAVRFGNVLGSSGSVIPTFKKQIAAGGPVTVTHPDITRFFMTVQEAVGLVLQSATIGQGGEIFVLDMGKPIKIVDVARQLIELSGFEPGVDIEIKYTGLRPGEKLYEELNHSHENLAPTEHPKIFRFTAHPPKLDDLKKQLLTLQSRLVTGESAEIKKSIKAIIPEYTPFLS